MKYLQDALKRLEVDASRHKERLQENAALLQFMWKADVVESWIGKFDTREILGYQENKIPPGEKQQIDFFYCLGEKLHQLRTDDLGHNLLSVQNLLTRHETFEAGLSNFEHEGIRSVTELKDELLVNRGHISSNQHDKIQGRYDLVLNK